METQVIATTTTDVLKTIGVQGGLAMAVVEALEYLKDKRWAPFITQHQPSLNRITGFVAAFVTALGLKMTFSAQAHTLMIENLCLTCVGAALWTAAKQWLIQQFIYRGWVGPRAIVAAVPPAAPVPLPVQPVK